MTGTMALTHGTIWLAAVGLLDTLADVGGQCFRRGAHQLIPDGDDGSGYVDGRGIIGAERVRDPFLIGLGDDVAVRLGRRRGRPPRAAGTDP